MSALAKLLSTQGCVVSGSDALRGETTENLAFYGIRVYLGEDGEREDLKRADLVVYTDAIRDTHLELRVAKRLNKRLIARADLLAMIAEAFPRSVAVAGSHGKTTCTSMCAHILKSVGVPFTAHIGGEDALFGNFYTSGEEYFITEACEYKRNMLKLRPSVAILLNIDLDHMECYKNEKHLIECFGRYCDNANTAFVCSDDSRCQKLGAYSTFGIKDILADYRATELRSNGECYAFTVEEYGKAICRIRLNAIGRCNVYNALASFSAMRSFGFHEKEIKRGLESFQAVKRRFEKIGTYHGAEFICDYAHHPKEIVSTLKTATGISKGTLYVVFQPHTYSRTKLLWKEFIDSLQGVKNLMIYKTYPAREQYDEEGSASRLADRLGSLYSENMYVLKTWIKKTVKDGDTVLFLGAGDIYYVAQYLLREL